MNEGILYSASKKKELAWHTGQLNRIDAGAYQNGRIYLATTEWAMDNGFGWIFIRNKT